MLSKKYRLNRREIEELKSKKGSVLQGRFFGLIFQAQKDERKFALIISNKISKKAVVRNKIKRLFFQILPQHQKAPLFKAGMNGGIGLSVRGFASETQKKPRALARGGSQKELTNFPEGKFLFLAKKHIVEADAEALENELEQLQRLVHSNLECSKQN